MIYLDASYLVKLYADEPGAEAVLAWVEGKGDFVCAAHGRLELFAAFKRHQREGALTGPRLRFLVQQVEGDEASGLIQWLPVSTELIAAACWQMIGLPPPVFLRAADAGLKEIYSHDRHLLAAAPHFKLKGIDVISSA